MLNTGDALAVVPFDPFNYCMYDNMSICVHMTLSIIIGLLCTLQSNSTEAIIAGLTCMDGCLRAAGHNSHIILAILANQYKARGRLI